MNQTPPAAAALSVRESGASSVSFVIPTFRETAFGTSLDALVEFLRSLGPRQVEIVVVDDSDDETRTQLRQAIEGRAASFPAGITARLLEGPRRGKGAAVRLGALSATGDVVFLLDADLPVPLHYIGEFLEIMKDEGADIVLGERSRDRYSGDALRHFLSRALWLIQRTVVFHGPAFEDTQCGFKIFRREALRRIVERQVVDGGMYDLEYLYAATLLHLKVERVAVAISDEVRPTRIHLWRCMFLDPLAIAEFKVRGILGHYS
jgi:dolichyl-phosphate beta-glucosyltransferase